MLKPASSLCNLRCRYCFYADVSQKRETANYGLMSRTTAYAIIAGLWKDIEEGDSLTLAFQGGEPTLAGLDFFKDFVKKAETQPKQVRLSWALQTNGILLDEDWCAFLKAKGFLVGLSLDGAAALHNQNRVDGMGRGCFNRVMEAKRRMDAHDVDYNMLCVLTNEAARHPQKLWRFILAQNLRYIQFIPCLDALDAEEESPWALTSRRFYEFYTALFPLWQKQALAGNYISVKLFDDIVNQFVRGQATACGMDGQCRPQNIVEADGGVYPCDFYVLDAYRLGNFCDMGLHEALGNAAVSGFLQRRVILPKACERCRYQTACQGGCKRLTRAMYVGESGFCGYRRLLDERLDALCATGRVLLK